MRNAIIVLVCAMLLPIAAFAADTATTAAPGAEPNMNPNGPITSHLVTDAPLPSDYVMGKASAPITMIEYASLSCPHCARFNNTTLVDLQKKYVDTGKMRYILRMFPLNDPALKAAILIECVGQKDKSKYFTFAKVLFDAQDKWAFDGNYMSGLETIASVGGVSKEQFEHCMANTDLEMRVLSVKKAATDDLKVPHTPYIIINGVAYEGDRETPAMSAYLDGLLGGAKK